jgi:uncharacterized protein (DUF1697 family)
MGRFAVFLRGINVGGNKKIGMADLRALLADLGYTEVATLLQSGNAVLTAAEKSPAKLARAIEAGISERFGMSVACFVRTPTELDAVIKADPFVGVADNPSKYLVIFLDAAPRADLAERVDPAGFLPEEYRVGEREIYMWLPNGQGESKLSEVMLGRKSGITGTGRNWNTVTKVAALLRP